MSRPQAILGFIFCGGLLIFLSPYLMFAAITKQLPWAVPVVAIPTYAVLSYGAFKRFWPTITRKAANANDSCDGRTDGAN